MKTINTMSEVENILRECIFQIDVFFGSNSNFWEILYDDTHETIEEKLHLLNDTIDANIEESDNIETKNFLTRIKNRIQGYI
jgi:hypothetical protein